MKMCLLIKVASGTNWKQGLMLAMINVGQEVELSHNEEQSVIFRPFFHFLSPCYLSSWLSGTSIYRCVCVCVCWEDDGTVGCRQGGSISTAHCPPSGTTGCYQPQPGSCSYNASLPVCVRMHFHPANNASLRLSQGSLNISSCLITQCEPRYLFQSYLQSRPLPSKKALHTKLSCLLAT